MKFSHNWLKELSGTKKSAEEVAELFLTHSFEVEGIENLAKGLDKVVIGEVLEVEKHPDADRLNVAKVNVGKENGGELQIVCGAPNLAVGQKVPVALVGAKIRPVIKTPTDKEKIFEIKKSKIRGVESFGMICAEDELGIGDNHEGIMVLSENAKVGQNFAEYMGLKDKILDIDILPNRGHNCLSYRGVALELQALESSEFSISNFDSNSNDRVFESKTLDDGVVSKTLDNLNIQSKFKIQNSKLENNLTVEIDTPNCSRYAGVRIKNIKIKPSPQWMQIRLKASGLKPINNIVDITNYVMLETNQPLHAFDAECVENIKIRQANDGEKIKLLDEQELKLTKDDIVITDGQKPIALAGVMGGLDSGIKDNTTEIILEGANFNSASIRFTARRHNLQTDAVYRFERDIDPNFVDEGISRAIELIEELADGKIESVTDVYPKPVKPWQINLNLNYVKNLLGVDISEDEVKNILTRLGITVTQSGSGESVLTCIIPTRRRDLKIEEDLIEEIGRIYGYDKISPKPLTEAIEVPHKNKQRFFERSLKDIMAHNGFDEVRGYSFYSKKNAQTLGLDEKKHLSLMNPMNPNQALIRQTLISGIVDACKKSLSYFDKVRLFDVGKVYIPQKGKQLPKEELLLTLAVTEQGEQGEQFFAVKEVLEKMFQQVHLGKWFYDDKIVGDEFKKVVSGLHPSRRAIIRVGKSGVPMGIIGELSKKALKHFGIKNARLAVAELDINALLNELTREYEYNTLAKFPAMERDLSVVVGDRTKVADVENLIYLSGEKLIDNVELFDLYVNPESGERSMAFHIIFSHPERTLQAQEVDSQMDKIVETLEKELDVKLKK